MILKSNKEDEIMDFATIKSVFEAFVGFLMKLLKDVGVIGEGEEDAAAEYKPIIDKLLEAVEGATKKD